MHYCIIYTLIVILVDVSGFGWVDENRFKDYSELPSFRGTTTGSPVLLTFHWILTTGTTWSERFSGEFRIFYTQVTLGIRRELRGSVLMGECYAFVN